jgi:hypothetical protein
VAKRNNSILKTVMAAFSDPIRKIKEDLLCCGIVGSLNKDIDFLCVIKEDGVHLPCIKKTRRVFSAVRRGIYNLNSAGFPVMTFTSFRTVIYLTQFYNKQERFVPLHLLMYAGENGLLFGEWPIIVKSMISEVIEIIPTDSSLLQHVDSLCMPPLRDRLWNYVQLVMETQALVNSYKKDMPLLMAEVQHKLRYVVRYSLAEYFYEQGLLTMTTLYKYRPTLRDLSLFVGPQYAKRLFILQKNVINGAKRGYANEYCEITMQLLDQILRRHNDQKLKKKLCVV